MLCQYNICQKSAPTTHATIAQEAAHSAHNAREFSEEKNAARDRTRAQNMEKNAGKGARPIELARPHSGLGCQTLHKSVIGNAHLLQGVADGTHTIHSVPPGFELRKTLEGISHPHHR